MLQFRKVLMGMLVVGYSLTLAQSTRAAGGLADETDVCIRNFFEPATKYDPCDHDQTGRYHYVQNVDDADATICAAAYLEFNCTDAPDTFGMVKTISDGDICTMNYDQPGVGNYCNSSPGLYQYGPGTKSED